MIRFLCPNCQKRLKCPDGGAGSKIACPRCGQKLLIPDLSKPASSNKTVLGELLPAQNRNQATPRPSISHLSTSDSEPLDVLPVDGTVIRRENGGGLSALGILFMIGGGLLAGIGFLLLCFFWLVYDTSVPVNDAYGFISGERVHNLGLMENRLIGVIVAGGVFAVGLVLALVGLFVTLARARK